MNTKDRRSLKTIKSVQDALLHLLTDKKLSEIKVVELCKEADINRTTFYMHYKNTAQVLQSIREQSISEIFEKFGNKSFLYAMQHPLEFFLTCTEIFSTYKNYEKFIRTSVNAFSFLYSLKKSFATKVCHEYKNIIENPNEQYEPIIFFIVSGIVDMYLEWLKSDKTTDLSDLFLSCEPLINEGLKILRLN